MATRSCLSDGRNLDILTHTLLADSILIQVDYISEGWQTEQLTQRRSAEGCWPILRFAVLQIAMSGRGLPTSLPSPS